MRSVSASGDEGRKELVTCQRRVEEEEGIDIVGERTAEQRNAGGMCAQAMDIDP